MSPPDPSGPRPGGSYDFSLARYVAARKGSAAARLREGAAYAYGGDLKIHSTLGRVRPVTLAMEATLRFWKTFGRAKLFGAAVRVGDKQFPRVHALVAQAAAALQIPAPETYVTGDGAVPEAQTLGTGEEAAIVINGGLLDTLGEKELLSRIGYECGHIQNGHAIYLTTRYFLARFPNQLVRWVAQPAILALNAWARRADVTCDRASLLCTRDLDVSIATLVKLTLRSQRLYSDVDVEDYLRQLAEHGAGPGRFQEIFAEHPNLPKRLQAMRLFAQTTLFRSVLSQTRAEGEPPGLTKDECDAQVGELLAVFP